MNTPPATSRFAGLSSFILRHWDGARRFQPENRQGTLGLPRAYYVASRRQVVRHLVSDEVPFIIEGLLAMGRRREARDQLENLVHLALQFGYLPATSLVEAKPSPAHPILGWMTRRYVETTNDDTAWDLVAPAIARELNFWRARRTAPMGLAFSFPPRAPRAAPPLPVSEGCFESGRRGGAARSLSVNVNMLLGIAERCLADYHRSRGDALEATRLADAAVRRADLVREWLWDEARGIFADATEPSVAVRGLSQTPNLEATIFHPVWLGGADGSQARRILSRLAEFEQPHGITAVAAASSAETRLARPALVFVTVAALRNGGQSAAATRLAGRFLSCVASNLRTTGDLWPGHDACSGNVPVGASAVLPGTMGVTAGVCLALVDMLESSPAEARPIIGGAASPAMVG